MTFEPYGVAGCRCWPEDYTDPYNGHAQERWMPNAACPVHGIRLTDIEPVALSPGRRITDPDEAEALGMNVDARALRHGRGTPEYRQPCDCCVYQPAARDDCRLWQDWDLGAHRHSTCAQLYLHDHILNDNGEPVCIPAPAPVLRTTEERPKTCSSASRPRTLWARLKGLWQGADGTL